MSKLLIKIFIKNYKNIEDDCVRRKYGELSSFMGILSNVLLFIIKIITGIVINSVAVIADSFNNLSDSLSSIITLLGFRLGARPADTEHPFGHGRIEYIAGFIISFIMMIIGVEFLKTSISKIVNPDDIAFSYMSIFILFITIIVKIWQSVFTKKIGKLINSHSLIASAIDSRNDVIITIFTIISLLIFNKYNVNTDGYFGVFISIFLIYSGFMLAKDTISPLLGEAIDKELEKKIKDISLKHDMVIGVHDVLVHNYGPNKNMASLHVEVPSTTDINACHIIVDKIERETYKKLGIFLTIHTDPVDINDKRIPKIISKVKKVLLYYSEEIDTHDYRIIDGEASVVVILDLVIPYNLSNKKRTNLILGVKEAVENMDKSYRCVINIENSFVK